MEGSKGGCPRQRAAERGTGGVRETQGGGDRGASGGAPGVAGVLVRYGGPPFSASLLAGLVREQFSWDIVPTSMTVAPVYSSLDTSSATTDVYMYSTTLLGVVGRYLKNV